MIIVKMKSIYKKSAINLSRFMTTQFANYAIVVTKSSQYVTLI